MNTNMTGFRWFFKNLFVLALWTKVAAALKGLAHSHLEDTDILTPMQISKYRNKFWRNNSSKVVVLIGFNKPSSNISQELLYLRKRIQNCQFV